MAQVTLVEAVGGSQHLSGKRWRARIIEGDRWGSSAYYPKEVLERDGARVFVSGLAMYLNHPTQTEQYDRPERDVNDLVGKLTSDAVYESDGLYADVEFYDSFVTQINEKHEDIGLSVRAHGLTEDAEMDGRYGPVLVALLAADSVDVVTKAGAGGKLTSILESDRDLAGALIETNKEGTQSVADVTKEDFEALKTALIEAIAGIPAALAESLAAKPETVVEIAATVDETIVEAAPAVVIDHAAVVEALATNHLPAASAGKIVSALTEGATLADAVAEQVTLREAFIATSTESGTVVINESDKTPRGLSRSVSVLG
jgi:hypothetical protein